MARTRQPQYPKRLQPYVRCVANPAVLENGIVSYALQNSANIIVGSTGELALQFNSGTKQVVGTRKTLAPLFWNSFVILFRFFQRTSPADGGTLLYVAPTSDTRNQIAIYELSSGVLRCDNWDSSNNPHSVDTGAIFSFGSIYTVAIEYDGAGMQWYCNGATTGSRLSGASNKDNESASFTIGSAIAGAQSGTELSLFTVCDYAPGRAQSLTSNPWQIYQPHRRMPIYFGAVAGGTATTIAPSKGALVVAGYAPAIAQPRVVAPTVGHVTLTGKQPGVVQPHVVAPAKGALTVTGKPPTLTQPRSIAAVKGTLTIAGYAPGVSQTASGTIAPSKGVLTLTGYAPGLEQDRTAAPAKGALVVTGKQPGIVQNVTTFIAPSKGTLTATGYVPGVAKTANQAIAPSAGTLTLAGHAPVLAQTGAQVIGPIKGALTLAGYAPTVQVIGAGITIVEPVAGALALAGYAPLIGLILAADALDPSRTIDRDAARIGSPQIGSPAVDRENLLYGTPAPSRPRPRLG